MGILALDRRIDAEVLDARGCIAVATGGARLDGVLKDAPQLYVAGNTLTIALSVDGARFEAVCRVLDEAVVVAPGTHMALEVLKARPADMSGIEPFDLVPLTPPHGIGLAPPTMSSVPEAAFEEDDEPTGVVGTLKAMPVTEIVQALSQGAKDAIVEVRPKGSPGGTIRMERGRVVYASCGELVGEPAFFAMLPPSRGAFRIRYGKHPGERNIDKDTTFLILEGARQMDEQNRAFEARATSVDMPVLPPASGNSGRFSRFFDEAGVMTPPPLPLPSEAQRFTSLKLPDMAELDDVVDAIDSDRTMRERKRPDDASFPPG